MAHQIERDRHGPPRRDPDTVRPVQRHLPQKLERRPQREVGQPPEHRMAAHQTVRRDPEAAPGATARGLADRIRLGRLRRWGTTATTVGLRPGPPTGDRTVGQTGLACLSLPEDVLRLMLE
ncbi:hypothetical protein GCM10010430_80460 [Kitasatospora cystarginea]|uniref:Uncharacterized protein n=1 Tax=Kitasatospora cystarginea TaxID=58350 RepID=A0ABP5S2R6_9ACTN